MEEIRTVETHRTPTSRPAKGVHEMDRLLCVAEVAELLGTTERFPRRLIAERRIRFVRVGRHVRIPLGAVREYVESETVTPLTVMWDHGRVVG